MKTMLLIIGIWSIVAFIARSIAIALIPYINKKRNKINSENKTNPIYDLTCDRTFDSSNVDDEFHLIPTIGISNYENNFTIAVKWLKCIYYITYRYKYADDKQ